MKCARRPTVHPTLGSPSRAHAPARRWLAPGGLMFPDAASLYVMGVDDRQHIADKKAFWSQRAPVRAAAAAAHPCTWRAAVLA